MRLTLNHALAVLAAAVCMGVSPAYAAVNGSHAKIPCTACHAGQAAPAAPAQKACLACHGSYEALAKKTEGKFNPHDSHMGRVECAQCHSMHKKSRFICHDCHAIPNRTFKGE